VKDTQKYVAEFLGTFTFSIIACGVAVVSRGQYLPTALAFGLVVWLWSTPSGPYPLSHQSASRLACWWRAR